MGSDARVRYSKMVIKNSFITLLKTKPVNKITVKEICERSEINRATFYKYYCNAYDLLDKLEQECLDELLQTVDNSTQQKWLYYFAAQGCSGILNQWICSGMSEPIHEVVDFTDKLVENTIKQS